MFFKALTTEVFYKVLDFKSVRVCVRVCVRVQIWSIKKCSSFITCPTL